MTFVRNILRDLVEKRLWPVAVALVLLLAGIPVFLGGGGGSGTVKPAPSATPAGGAPSGSSSQTASLVTTGDTTPLRRSRGGKLRNPFVQPEAKAANTPTTPTGTTPSPGGGSPGGPGGSGPGTPPSYTPPAPKPETPDTADLYRVDLQFGQTGHQRWIRDIPRLTPLPSVDNPFFVFLGVLQDGETAVFMVSTDADANGDAKCRPSRRDCQTIELQAGETEFFDLIMPSGKAVQYQMDLRSIRKLTVSGAAARAAYAMHSRDGAEIVRAAADQVETAQVRAYHYRPADGVLVRAKADDAGAATASDPVLREYRFLPGEVDVFQARLAAQPAG